MAMNDKAAPPAPGERPGYRYYVLAVLILVYMLNFLDRQIIGILAAPLKAEFNLSDTQFGLLGGLSFALLYSTLGVPVAWLADRFSRVWIMTAALTMWSGFTALCGVAGSFSQLFLCRMGVGIGEAGGAAPAFSLISDYFPPSQRARALAAFSLGIPLGLALGTLVGGLIAATYGWRAAFIFVGLLGVLVAPLLRLTVRDPRRGGMEVSAVALPDPGPTKAPAFGQVLKTLLPKPSFWLLAFGAASASVCGYGVAAWLPSFFMRSFGLSLADTAWYYSGITLIGATAGIWFGGQLADSIGRRFKGGYPLVPAISFLISIPCFILAMNSQIIVSALLPETANNSWQALTLAFLIFLVPTGLNLAWLGPVTAAVQHLVPATMRTTASALYLLINNLLGIGVGVFYFGWMSDLLAPTFGTESLRWSIYTGMGFYLLSAVLLICASRSLRKDWVD